MEENKAWERKEENKSEVNDQTKKGGQRCGERGRRELDLQGCPQFCVPWEALCVGS